MSTPSAEEVRAWTPEDRGQVARLLDELVDRPRTSSGVIRRRRLSIVAAAAGAIVMVPWIGDSRVLPSTG